MPRQMSMQEALAKLRTHLKTHPDDLTGWLLLARSEVGLGRYREGAEAYARAAELSSDRPDIAADWGEAQVMAEGSVTPEAVKAFEAGLKDTASAPKSRYYLALAKLEQGDPRGALQDWADLAADFAARRRMAEAAAPAHRRSREGGGHRPRLGHAVRRGGGAGGTAPARPAESGMPSQETVAATAKATQGASPEERRAMIESMVERLASRLEQQPDDAEGWARLGRSYMVLQQPAKARDAYARAVKLRPDDAALSRALAEATRGGREAARGNNPVNAMSAGAAGSRVRLPGRGRARIARFAAASRNRVSSGAPRATPPSRSRISAAPMLAAAATASCAAESGPSKPDPSWCSAAAANRMPLVVAARLVAHAFDRERPHAPQATTLISRLDQTGRLPGCRICRTPPGSARRHLMRRFRPMTEARIAQTDETIRQRQKGHENRPARRRYRQRHNRFPRVRRREVYCERLAIATVSG